MPIAVNSVDVPNLLLGLAWLGELDRLQIQRLWFVGKSESTVEKTLARLHKEGLIAKRSGSVRDEQRGVTVPQLARWSLTPAGHAEIKGSAQYPTKLVIPRQKHLFVHDTRTTAAIVKLIELGQQGGLSGIFVARELQLNPRQRRPVCDALVVMQFGAFDRPNIVPWSSDPAIADEGRLRFAIEADNNTEPLAVLGGKAEAYRKLAEDRTWAAWWQQQHGPLPVPLWVAPTKERALAIHREWRRAWPTGEWIITSDEGLEQNELLNWKEQREQTMRLRLGKRKQELAPPTPQEAVPAFTPPLTVPARVVAASSAPEPPAQVTRAAAPAPGQQGVVLRKLRLDERLSVHDCRGEPSDGFLWWEVEGEDGIRGWVATAWLEETISTGGSRE